MPVREVPAGGSWLSELPRVELPDDGLTVGVTLLCAGVAVTVGVGLPVRVGDGEGDGVCVGEGEGEGNGEGVGVAGVLTGVGSETGVLVGCGEGVLPCPEGAEVGVTCTPLLPSSTTATAARRFVARSRAINW